jgi:hypothetical protein
MLDEFLDIKPFLSIVNKSFVTIRKPIRIYDANVYFRDTILLTAAGMNSMDKLGSLYWTEGDYSKISIHPDDNSRMGSF